MSKTPPEPGSGRLRLGSCVEAADLAYRMASRWGGTFVVLAPAEGERGFAVVGEDARRPAGIDEVGRASSLELGDLTWQWGPGYDGTVPASPFDRLPRPETATIMAHLAPETRVLMDCMGHLMAVQKALAQEDRARVRQLLSQDGPARTVAGEPVRHEAYLRQVEGRGMVQAETERVRGVLAAAAEALGPNTDWQRVSDVVFGRAAGDVSPSRPGRP